MKKILNILAMSLLIFASRMEGAELARSVFPTSFSDLSSCEVAVAESAKVLGEILDDKQVVGGCVQAKLINNVPVIVAELVYKAKDGMILKVEEQLGETTFTATETVSVHHYVRSFFA